MNRRGLLLGLGSLLAAPAIARASSLMLLRGAPMEVFIGYDIARSPSGLLILVPRWLNDGKITYPTLCPPNDQINYFIHARQIRRYLPKYGNSAR